MTINALIRQKGCTKMKHPQTATAKYLQNLLMVAAPVGILACMAAMNGGTALEASAFDSVVTTLKSMLSSTWVMMLAIIVLVVAVWQLAHGGGYKTVGLVIGVLAIALVGPTFLTTISTAMPTTEQVAKINAQHHVVQVAQATLTAGTSAVAK